MTAKRKEEPAKFYRFDRYRDGQKMAQGIQIENADTLEQATAKAAKLLASNYPRSDVLVFDNDSHNCLRFSEREPAALRARLREVEAERNALAAHVGRYRNAYVGLTNSELTQDADTGEFLRLADCNLMDEFDAIGEGAIATSLARRDAELLNRPFEGLPGCTDGGCVVKKPDGMHTNGGCQCIKHQTASTIVQRLARLRDQFRQQAEGGGDE
ncbi:hypothetical protein NFG57_11050 [Halomonas sp. H10-59]|uniref:Uncharacterized protein n=1 Tax=Halomonas sp. H10-59 TaxID=2950874 RepID=A0AAU7KNV8_9GAMM